MTPVTPVTPVTPMAACTRARAVRGEFVVSKYKFYSRPRACVCVVAASVLSFEQRPTCCRVRDTRARAADVPDVAIF